MEYSGYHLVVDLFGCDSGQLEDEDYIRRMMENLAAQLQTPVMKSVFHKFQPQGLSGALIIGASHLTIHTWPENGYVGIDIFTCSKCFSCERVKTFLAQALVFSRAEYRELLRGRTE